MKLIGYILKAIPHLNIAFAVMYMVFFVIDMQNEAMNFINNDMTKIILLAMSCISLVCSVLCICLTRKEERKDNGFFR